MVAPRHGSIWWADLGQTVGHEQHGRRPVLVISSDTFNFGPRNLIFVLPMTRSMRPYPFHVPVEPSETGLNHPGAIMCDQIRSVSTRRLLNTLPAGQVSDTTLRLVESHLETIMRIGNKP